MQPNRPITAQQTSTKPVAWITGSGAPRVGRAVAEYFAQSGYRIALHANHSLTDANQCAASWNAKGIETIVTSGPVESETTAKQSVAQILNAFGQLDVLVHSAAIWDWKPLEDTTAADVMRQMNVNSLGTFLCCQEAGLHMVKQPQGGAIVMIGDWAVVRPCPDFSAYFAGKGAIETMVRSFAVELASRNPAIRVNGIMPGPVMLDTSITPEKAEQIRHNSLLKRHGTPEHVAQAAMFLANHEFITGVCLPVDGGRSIYAGPTTDQLAHPTYTPNRPE